MRIAAIVLILIVLNSSFVYGERPLLSTDQLKKESTHIVTGTVKGVYQRDADSNLQGKGTVVTQYLVEIEVDTVEKGDKLEKSDLVYARCWRIKKHGDAGVVPGPSGHAEIPKPGDDVRAFLAKGTYSATSQSDRGTAVVYPNGIEKLKKK
jgi:hypothetical protein